MPAFFIDKREIVFMPGNVPNVFCPNEESALVIIVVSLPFTAYHWATLIAL